MTRVLNIVRKKRLLAGLANIAFLLSILLCSGYISESGLGQQKSTQTEIKLSSGKTSKSTFYFGHSLFVTGASVVPVIDPASVNRVSLMQYGKSIATRFRSNLKQRLTIAKQVKIPSVKYIPRSTDALISYFSRG